MGRRYSAYQIDDPWRFARVLLLATLIIGAIAGSIFLYLHHKNKPDSNNVKGVIILVSKHAVLPQGEEPALASVTDSGKLNTTFLKQAVNGDKILIYEKNKKAIIYRPSIDRIIDIGPVNIEPANTVAPVSN